jgi:uncharacterized protein YndB with AHSA1/START domain
MSTETVLVSEVIPATRERLYAAWLDSGEHSAFTADIAEIEPYVGGTHSAFSGYATGQVLALEPNRRIVQSWRSTDFPEGADDSRLEVTFEETSGGTMITLLHTGIPSGQSDRCRESWLESYLQRMKKYFGTAGASDGIGNGERARGALDDLDDDEEDDDETPTKLSRHLVSEDEETTVAQPPPLPPSRRRPPSRAAKSAPQPSPAAKRARPAPRPKAKARPAAKASPARAKRAPAKPAGKGKTAAKAAARRPAKPAKAAKGKAKPKAKAKPAAKRPAPKKKPARAKPKSRR